MDPLTRFRKSIALSLLAFLLAYVALPQSAQAVSPAPDGGYPGGNTAEGQNALLSLGSGSYNTGVGLDSLLSITDGNFCTGLGAGTLLANTANNNTATGAGALLSNATGSSNTANGAFALFSNKTGSTNTANGVEALLSNTSGSGNVATGPDALLGNTIGNDNTAIGTAALSANMTASFNSAVGSDALFNNSTGTSNTAIGASALFNNTTGSNDIALGQNAGSGVTTASNVIAIGTAGNDVNDSCYIGNIFGATSSGGIAVLVNTNGRLGTVPSSRRFKDNVKPMAQASEALFALQPVSFRYKKKLDPAGTSQFGLVAEDVERLNPDLVVRDKEGKPYSVRYDQVNAMLLNEFLKEHSAFLVERRKVQALEANAARQQKQIKALTAGLQKLSEQLGASKSEPQVTANAQ